MFLDLDLCHHTLDLDVCKGLVINYGEGGATKWENLKLVWIFVFAVC